MTLRSFDSSRGLSRSLAPRPSSLLSRCLLAGCLLVAPSLALSAHAEGDAAKTDRKFAVAIAATSDTGWDAIRYDVHAGKAWKLKDGSWLPLVDSGELPASDYEVQLVALKGDWGAIRVDVRSGRSWRATPDGWMEIGEVVQSSPPPAGETK